MTLLPKPLRVILYLRVSTEEQARESHSLEAQLKICSAFAEQRGWTVAAVYRDPEDDFKQAISPRADGRRRAISSGKTDRRPGFQKMIAAVRAGSTDVVLTHKLDRFSRSLADILVYLREFNTLGVAYASATEQFDFTTPIGKILLALLAAFAEWYLDNLSQETKKGKRQRAEEGFWNGDLSFGYRRAPDKIHAEPDPDTAPGVVLAFERYAEGISTDLEIARLLNRTGYRTGSKRGPQTFSKDTVKAMLQNRFYVGQVKYKDELFTGQQPALVSMDVFERCQTVRRRLSRRPRRPNPKARTYPLSGLIFCADCRRALRGQMLVSNTVRYYRDVAADHDQPCPNRRTLRAEPLEAEVAGLLMAIRLPESWKMQIVNQAAAGFSPDESERRRARAEEKLRRARELYLESLIDRRALDQRLREAQTELDALRPAPQPDIKKMTALLDDLPRLWKLAMPEERKTLLQAMLERVFVRGPQIVALQPRVELYPFLHQMFTADPTSVRFPIARFTLPNRPSVSMLIIPPATPLARIGAWA